MEFYESFMKFSFPDDEVFCIEADPLVIQSEGIKACECIVFINPRVALIEAKSSSPKDIRGDKFNTFITDIKQKFSDSLLLFNKIKNKDYGEEVFQRLPLHLRDVEITSTQYVICLIVHGHQIDWLEGLLDAFRDAMRDVVAKWKINDSQVKVFNEETALDKRLIVGFIPKSERDLVRDQDGNANQEKLIRWFASHNLAESAETASVCST